MISLAMRREDRPSTSSKLPPSTPTDEFVDILQVQQLLINDSRRDSHPGTSGVHSSMGGEPGTSQGHSRPPPLEAAAYYYGGPQGHHFHPTTPGSASVDELVAMWLSSGTAPSDDCTPNFEVGFPFNPLFHKQPFGVRGEEL
nr:unnamed protein product [Callosobruchus chinensis]